MTSRPTIAEIGVEQDALEAAGVPQWKRQIAFEDACFARNNGDRTMTTTFLDDAREAARQIVARGPNGEQFTRQRLLDLFSVVANPDNWKVEIDATIDLAREDVEALKQAIVFFTGSEATIEYLGNGLEARVTAAGYYQTCGA